MGQVKRLVGSGTYLDLLLSGAAFIWICFDLGLLLSGSAFICICFYLDLLLPGSIPCHRQTKKIMKN
jgi:hypothetical protein